MTLCGTVMMTENHDDDDYGGKEENENEAKEKNGYTVPVLYNHRTWKLTVPCQPDQRYHYISIHYGKL